MDSRFAWFGAWVDQHLLLTFTAVSGSESAHLLTAFGAAGFDRGDLTLSEAHDLDAPTVRVGRSGGWTYGVEHASTVGGDPATLRRATGDGALGVSLCFTPTIRTVQVARGGEHLTGFEADDPDFVRWGTTPHAFDPQIAEAGWMDPGDERPAAACARFLQILTGLELSGALLEAPLPCATLPS